MPSGIDENRVAGFNRDGISTGAAGDGERWADPWAGGAGLQLPADGHCPRPSPSRPELIGQLNILSLLSFLLWAALLGWAAGGARNDAVISRFVGRPGQRGRLVALVAALVGAGVASTAYALSRQ